MKRNTHIPRKFQEGCPKQNNEWELKVYRTRETLVPDSRVYHSCKLRRHNLSPLKVGDRAKLSTQNQSIRGVFQPSKKD